ncbi:uncharacterized protein LOC130567584 isoform X1 [Triplophysa rosa]|uniref:uncharacterized protein LOC130567584 isoform X1 n=1 Tax=Triplophysa rosa TaxID=992332 RepID=UPI00254626F6|nr:uncharacterized protein LOC130567584 isoform X1 [Triplophysa rosa]
MLCSTGSPGSRLWDLLSFNKDSVSTDVIRSHVRNVMISTLTVVVVGSRTHRCKEYFCSDVADPGYSLIGHWLLNAPPQANSKVCVLRLETVFTIDQQSEKNVIRVERRVSSAEDVKDQTSDDEENSVSPSSPVDLPVITADNLDYVIL